MMQLRRLAFAAWCVLAGSALRAADVVMPMFRDGEEAGWFSHQASIPTVESPTHTGSRAMVLRLGRNAPDYHDTFEFTMDWTRTFSSEPFDALEFWMYGGDNGTAGQKLVIAGKLINPLLPADRGGHYEGNQVTVPDDQGRYVEGGLRSLPPRKWVKVRIPLEDIGCAKTKQFRGIAIRAAQDMQPPVYLDDMQLVGKIPETVMVSVDATKPVRAVNERIFGICTYSTPGVDSPTEVEAAIDARYRFQRVFYPTFNMRGGSVNIQKGMLFAEATGADMIACVNWSDMGPKEPVAKQASGKRQYGTPQEAAAYVAYANVPVDAPAALLGKVIGIDEHGYDWKTVGYWVDLRAKQQRLGQDDGFNQMRIGRANPWGVKYWELDNEPWMHARDKDWLLYANFCKQADRLMKEIDPTIKTGVTILASGGDADGVGTAIKDPKTGQEKRSFSDVVCYYLAGHDPQKSPGKLVPDFIVEHNYAGGDSGNADLVTLLTHQQITGGDWAGEVRGLRGYLATYYTPEEAAKPFIYAGEWNMRPTFPLSRQYTSIVGGLYVADALGMALQRPDITMMTLHDWNDGPIDKGGFRENPEIYGWRHETGYGVYRDGGRTRYPTHYAFKMLSRHFAAEGDSVLPATTSSILLQPYAVKQRNGNLAVLLLNKTPQTLIQTSLQFTGYQPAKAMTVCSYGLEQDREEGDIAVRSSEFGGTIAVPPYSMVLLTLTSPGTAAPAAPTSITATPGNGRVTLRWTAMSGAQTYDVYTGNGSGELRLLKEGIAATAIIHDKLSNGQTYRYAVVARSANGSSIRSEVASATPLPPPAAAPEVRAQTGDSQVLLTWAPVPGATDYTVRRGSSPQGPFEVLTRHPYARDTRENRVNTLFCDRSAQSGGRYTYQVVATSVGGEGPVATVSVTMAELPKGWRSADTTGRQNTGYTLYDPAAGRWRVAGEGNGEYEGSDGRFVYQKVRGDFEISARVMSAEHGQYGKNNFGVAFRSSLTRAPFWSAMGITPFVNNFTQGPQFYLWSSSTQRIIHREADDRRGISAKQHAPYWVKLSRKGTVVTGWISADGANWQQWRQVEVKDLPQELLVGMIAQSNYPYAVAAGEFEQVKLTGEIVADR